MATLVHLCLGTVYAWSFSRKPSPKLWLSNSETAWAFSLAILCWVSLQVGADKIYRNLVEKISVNRSFSHAFGYIISYFALQNESLWLLYFGYGIVGELVLGLAYVTPVATVSKWFPDKQGLVTGMVVMDLDWALYSCQNFWHRYF